MECILAQGNVTETLPPDPFHSWQVVVRLRECATVRAMNSAATARGYPDSNVSAFSQALKRGESGKPCKLRMQTAQVQARCLPPFQLPLYLPTAQQQQQQRAPPRPSRWAPARLRRATLSATPFAQCNFGIIPSS